MFFPPELYPGGKWPPYKLGVLRGFACAVVLIVITTAVLNLL
jgi:hypothetical protein